jgi:hypothetical protein
VVPVFDKVTGTDALEPTVMFPNGMLPGVAVSAPWVPIPLRGMFSVGFVAVEVIAIFPGTVPFVVGAKVPVSVAVAPAAIVCPVVRPLALKPGPVVVT